MTKVLAVNEMHCYTFNVSDNWETALKASVLPIDWHLERRYQTHRTAWFPAAGGQVCFWDTLVPGLLLLHLSVQTLL